MGRKPPGSRPMLEVAAYCCGVGGVPAGAFSSAGLCLRLCSGVAVVPEGAPLAAGAVPAPGPLMLPVAPVLGVFGVRAGDAGVIALGAEFAVPVWSAAPAVVWCRLGVVPDGVSPLAVDGLCVDSEPALPVWSPAPVVL